MDGILDNQEVTADVLNSISVDLGGDDLKFSVAEKFGADKLNSITGDLTGPGVLFSGNRCNVTVSDGKIYVQDGIIVFNSGAKKTITSSVEVCNTAVSKLYVYAYNNTSANMIQLIAAEEAPSVGDYVMLAEVTGTTVIDKRTVSFSKVGKGTTVIEKHTFSGTIPGHDRDSAGNYTEIWRVSTNIESPKLLILSAIAYICGPNVKSYYWQPVTYTYDCAEAKWFKDLAGGNYSESRADILNKSANFPRSNGGSDTIYINLDDDSGHKLKLQATIAPNEIVFYADNSSDSSYSNPTYDYGFVLAII